MKKLCALLLLMSLLLAACSPPTASPDVVSCEFLSEKDGSETWRLTYEDGSTREITVRGPAEASLSVTSCERVTTEGLVDTYRITFSDGTAADFSVTNGAAGAAGATGPAGPAGPAGLPGTAGSSPTVSSCEKVAEDSEKATWRITFSDGGTADFTVPVTEGASVGWEDVIDKVDILFGALDIKRLPSATVGNSTVTDGGASDTTEALSSTFSGWACLMTKDVMFGAASTVYGITLKQFRIADIVDSVLIDIHFLDISEASDFRDATVFKTYTVEIEPNGLDDYLLEVEIPKEELAGLGDTFMLGFETRGEGRVGMKPSRNRTFRVESELLSETFSNGTYTYYSFSGYYTRSDSNTRGYSCPTYSTAFDLFFSTAYEEEYSFEGTLGGGGTEAEPEDTTVTDLLRLPEQYDLVVGDTFELFYKGITFCADSAAYDYSIAFSGGEKYGKAYSRKWVYTPAAADVGVHTMEITLWSNEGQVLDTATVKLNILEPPTSPDEETVVLIIGDSLTSGGTWPKELNRRLTATGGTPGGLGLSNITFIGSKEKDGVRYEGYGGWNFDSYTTANRRNDFMILTGNFSDKEEAVDQHSTYRASNNTLWKIEWVTATEMKIICTGAAGALPSTAGGTLTHVSGGVNHADIVYTSARQADANPFWDNAAGENDFVAYAERYGVTEIDEVILFMGWNEYARTPEQFKTRAQKLIDSILADYPDCHISLVGLQIPSRDGFANNYGITWPWFPMLEKVFAFEDAYRALAADAKYAGKLSVVSIAGQYDAEYNEIKGSQAVNNRNPATETIGTNGVHPSEYGYLQIADAIYRHMCARLGE